MKKTELLFLSILICLFLHGCIRRDPSDLRHREEYSLCLNSEKEVEYFKKYLVSFANNEGMAILDRSANAEQELRNLDRGNVVLNRTAGSLVLMTIENKDSLRISITNAGLDNDLNLTFRYSSNKRPFEATTVLEFASQRYRTIPIGGTELGALSCN